MSVDMKSQFIKKLAAKAKTLKEAAKTTYGGAFLSDQEFLDLMEVGVGEKVIVNVKLTSFGFGIDKNKDQFFRPAYAVVEGPNRGTPFSEFIGLPEQDDKRYKRGIETLFRILQHLGYDTTEWDASDLPGKVMEAIEDLNRTKPGVKVALSRYVPDQGDDRLNISVIGLTDETLRDDADDAEEEEKASMKPKPKVKPKAKEEPTLAEMGEAADNGDDEAIEKLTSLAEEAGIDINDYGPWADLAAALEPSEEETEEEEEPQIVVRKKGTKAKADLGDGLEAIKVVSYDEDTNEYTVSNNAGDEYEISADDIQW